MLFASSEGFLVVCPIISAKQMHAKPVEVALLARRQADVKHAPEKSGKLACRAPYQPEMGPAALKSGYSRHVSESFALPV